MSAVVLAVVARIVAIDEFEGAGVVAERAEGDGGAGGGGATGIVRVQCREVRHFRLPAHFVVHAGLFQTPDAHLTPAGDGHVFDEGFLEGSLGLEFFEKSGEEFQKAIRGLAVENDGGGQHSVSDGVAGGGALALRSDRAMGFGAVGAGCVFLTFGTHATKRTREKGAGAELEGNLLIRWRI